MGQADDNKAIDRGFDAKPLTELQAGIWIDPNGCHHWIIDDGVEGYMDARRYPDGRPVCDPSAVRNSVGGAFKAGGTSLLGDPIKTATCPGPSLVNGPRYTLGVYRFSGCGIPRT